MATSSGIYVYSSKKNHPLLAQSSFRAQPNSGFYEVTGLSHLGISFPYLALLKESGNPSWLNHVKMILDQLNQLHTVNQTRWLYELDQAAWRGREDLIQDMLQYSIEISKWYSELVLSDPDAFNMQHVIDNYLESKTSRFPISYNAVMIGTFSTVALYSAYEIYSALTKPSIDWSQAKVLLHNQAGRNYSAGLTSNCNWVYPTIKSIGGDFLPRDRMFIVPYASIPSVIGQKNLSDKDYDSLVEDVWGALYAAPRAASLAFTHIPDITIPTRKEIPGDFRVTDANNINDFMRRLKFSTTNPQEMLSNTVGYWLAGEANEKSWDLMAMDIPGLTHGLPAGIKNYGDAL